MNIIKILKTNKSIFEGSYEKAGSHYYVSFKCDKCSKEVSKQKRRIELNGFLCSSCIPKKKHSEETKRKIGIASKKNNTISSMNKELTKKYGVNNSSKIDAVIKKRKETNNKKYGGSSPMSSQTVRRKVSETLLRKSLYDIINSGYTPMFDLDDYIGKHKNEHYKWKCNECDTEFIDKFNDKKILPRCPKCNPFIKGDSKGETEMFNFINQTLRENNDNKN